ncbi:MAG: class I SAM-dependent methyltransferase [Pseudomonadota bacterium]
MRNIDIDQERAFENQKVTDGSPRKSQSRFYWAVDLPTKAHFDRSLARIRGLKALEVGCSSGEDAVLYAASAKRFVGVDLSDEAIFVARSRNIENAEFHCTDAHILPFGDAEFDVVIVNSLLHHLDLDVALTEIQRVLTPKGVLVFREPLGTNPLFQLYRYLTPNARTIDERPFTFADLRLLKSKYDVQESDWFGFFNIVSAFGGSKKLRAILTDLDAVLAKTPIKYFFWQFAGFGVVRK